MRSENFTLGTCEDNSNYCDFFYTCVYHDVKSLNNVVNLKTDELFILHFNVRSLQKNVDNLVQGIPDLVTELFLKHRISSQYHKQNLHMVNHW